MREYSAITPTGKKVQIVYADDEKTRLFGVFGKDDRFLCPKHAIEYVEAGRCLTVPASAAARLMGLQPFPSGKEPCEECECKTIQN